MCVNSAAGNVSKAGQTAQLQPWCGTRGVQTIKNAVKKIGTNSCHCIGFII
jgi:hypothetical protein